MTEFQSASISVPSGENSEDRAAIFRLDGPLLTVVADGAGGVSGAERAADGVVYLIGEAIEDGFTGESGPAWADLLAKVDREIYEDPYAGETAAVIAYITDSGVMGAGVGDCVAWMVGPRIDDLTSRMSRKPLLGTGFAVPVPFEIPELHGTLLLASDGLVKYVKRDVIQAELAGPHLDAVCERLVDRARMKSGHLQDDISVILVRKS